MDEPLFLTVSLISFVARYPTGSRNHHPAFSHPGPSTQSTGVKREYASEDEHMDNHEEDLETIEVRSCLVFLPFLLTCGSTAKSRANRNRIGTHPNET